MSARATTWVWEHSESKGLDRLVLLAIADEANHRGEEARASLEDISSKAKVAKSTAQGCTKRLERMEELEVTMQGNGRGRITVYALKGMRKRTGGGTLPGGERYAKVPGAEPFGNGSPPQPCKEVSVLSPPQQGSFTSYPPEDKPLGGADAPSNDSETSPTQTLVAYYVAECTSRGWGPLEDDRNQIAKQVLRIRREKPDELIRSALRIAADERKSPSALPRVIADIEAGRYASGHSS
jgi:hypothetical protein